MPILIFDNNESNYLNILRILVLACNCYFVKMISVKNVLIISGLWISFILLIVRFRKSNCWSRLAEISLFIHIIL